MVGGKLAVDNRLLVCKYNIAASVMFCAAPSQQLCLQGLPAHLEG